MRYPLIFITTILLASCTSTYKRIDVTDVPHLKLNPQGKVLIVTSKDGRYNDIDYPGSGTMTSQAIKAAFDGHSNFVSITSDCKSIDSCLIEAKRSGDSYLVSPEILHWEERASILSGLPDRIEVKITILSVDNGKVIHSTIIAGKSQLATFRKVRPQDLLPQPINEYVSIFY